MEAFEGLLSYLYTNSVNILVEYVPSLLLLSKQCKLTNLEQLIEAELDNLHEAKRLIIVPPTLDELEEGQSIHKEGSNCNRSSIDCQYEESCQQNQER